MNKEIEATFLDIDKNGYRAKLKKAGAKLIHPEVLVRRTVFDTGSGSFLRVRDEGQKIVMTYKNIEKLSLEGVNEVNVEVDSYGNTITLLTAAGLKVKALQATLREKWVLDYGVAQNDVNYCPEIVIGKTPVFLDGLDLVA